MACKVNVTGGALSQQEIDLYLARAREKFGREPYAMHLHLDGDEVEITYDYGNQPFQRTRRITGYLVGGMERWNNAKRAEERDRIKHPLQG